MATKISDISAERRVLGRMLIGNPALPAIALRVAQRTGQDINEVIRDLFSMIDEAKESNLSQKEDAETIMRCARERQRSMMIK